MKLTTNRITKLPLFKSVCDGRGLYLRLSAPGSGSWTFKYMKDSTKHELGLGSYPLVSLSLARQKRNVLKGQLALGEEPFTPITTLNLSKIFNIIYCIYFMENCISDNHLSISSTLLILGATTPSIINVGLT